jgi:hypothetical protein
MDTDGDRQQNWLVQIGVNDCPCNGTEALRRLLAAVARDERQEIGNVSDQAGSLMDSRQSRPPSFLTGVARLFYCSTSWSTNVNYAVSP